MNVAGAPELDAREDGNEARAAHRCASIGSSEKGWRLSCGLNGRGVALDLEAENGLNTKGISKKVRG